MTSIAPPEFAVPDTVYSFEPSGLKFNERVQLTLPNVNEFPPGMEVIILSKNTEKGIWEIDGAALVSDDGSEIITKENMGISHFSEVYAAPYPPKVSEYMSKDRPGFDVTSGIHSSQITLPSYKSLGQDIAPA